MASYGKTNKCPTCGTMVEEKWPLWYDRFGRGCELQGVYLWMRPTRKVTARDFEITFYPNGLLTACQPVLVLLDEIVRHRSGDDHSPLTFKGTEVCSENHFELGHEDRAAKCHELVYLCKELAEIKIAC